MLYNLLFETVFVFFTFIYLFIFTFPRFVYKFFEFIVSLYKQGDFMNMDILGQNGQQKNHTVHTAEKQQQ